MHIFILIHINVCITKYEYVKMYVPILHIQVSKHFMCIKIKMLIFFKKPIYRIFIVKVPIPNNCLSTDKMTRSQRIFFCSNKITSLIKFLLLLCISSGIIEFSTTTSQVSRGKLGEGASEIIPVGICKQGRFCITLALKKCPNFIRTIDRHRMT